MADRFKEGAGNYRAREYSETLTEVVLLTAEGCEPVPAGATEALLNGVGRKVEQVASLTARVEAQAARIEELEGALEVIGRRADKTLLEASSRRDLEDGLSLVGMRASRALQARGDDDGE